MSEDENPGDKAMSWNAAGGRLFERGLLAYRDGRSRDPFDGPGAGSGRKKASLAQPHGHQAADMEKKIRSGRFNLPQAAATISETRKFWLSGGRRRGLDRDPIEVKAKEPLHLVVEGTAMAERRDGWQASLDGVKIGAPLDFHAPQNEDREFPLLDFWPEPGLHTLRLECVGRDATSLGTSCAVESVRLMERRPRVAAMAHDKNKDWRKEPRLYQ